MAYHGGIRTHAGTTLGMEHRCPRRHASTSQGTRFIEFLFYLRMVVTSEALTPMCTQVFPAYQGLPSCRKALVRELYGITSLSNQARKPSQGMSSCDMAVRYSTD